jgi:hypothetical protein
MGDLVHPIHSRHFAAVGEQQAFSSCTGGHFTSPKEQNTQQSPANGRSNL